MLLAFLGYNTLVGGDWMPFFRFLAPAAPFAALLLGLLLERMQRVTGWALGLALTLFSVLPLYDKSVQPKSVLEPLDFRSFQVGYQTEWERWKTGVRNLEAFRKLGLALKEISTPEDSLTFGAIGAVGYESGLRIHDRNGLVDREVAESSTHGRRSAGHDKRVPRSFFLHRKPTIYHAFYLEGDVGARGSTSFEQASSIALQNIILKVFQQSEGESSLRSACLPEAHRIPASEAIGKGGLLMILRATPDGARARAFWDRTLGPESDS